MRLQFVIQCMVFNKAATTCLPACSTVRSTFVSNIRFHEWPINIFSRIWIHAFLRYHITQRPLRLEYRN